MKKPRLFFIDYVFTVVIGILIFVAYLSYQRINGLVEASQLVYNSNQIKLDLERSFSYLKDAETSQRGFLLTHDSTFLEPFYGAYDKSNELLNQALSLMEGDSVRGDNIKRLQAALRVRYDVLNVVFRISDSVNAHSTVVAHLLSGKRSMDQIRTRISEIIQSENSYLEQKIKERNQYASISPVFILALSFITLAITFLAFIKIKSDSSHLEQLVKDLQLRDKQLTTKNEELEVSNTELASFSYVASHDLKEPLRKIQLFTERIMDKESDKLSQSGKEDFNRITSAVVRMQNLFDALLSFSRANSAEDEMVLTDLNNTLNEAKIDLKELIEEKSVTIESVSLPKLKVVPVQFQQLFLNIIGNAIKYSKEGVPPQIKITTRKVLPQAKQKEGWEISFSDNGIGFEQQFESKIFQLFQRLHGKSEYTGTGIGLAICKKIISNHGGTIRATGQPGVGAVFTIYIPS